MEPEEDLPVREVTVNQVVASNIAWYRRAAGMTQKELGEKVGWSNASVSEAERSWDGKRTREFDAHDLASLAVALGVPIGALFLPPADDELDERYVFSTPMGEVNMGGLLLLAVPDDGTKSAVMDAYRERLSGAVTSYFDQGFAEQIMRMLRDPTDAEINADRIARLRHLQNDLAGDAARVAAILGEFADAAEKLETGDE